MISYPNNAYNPGTETRRIYDAYWAGNVFKYQDAITLLINRHGMTAVAADNFLHPLDGKAVA